MTITNWLKSFMAWKTSRRDLLLGGGGRRSGCCFNRSLTMKLAAIILLAIIVLAFTGCGETETRHTWGEIGFYQWRDDGSLVPDPTPIPPDVWDRLQKDELTPAPEEPKHYTPQWRVWP